MVRNFGLRGVVLKGNDGYRTLDCVFPLALAQGLFDGFGGDLAGCSASEDI